MDINQTKKNKTMENEELYEYLKHEWIFNCHKKYHYMFDVWFENITDNQILYFTSWMKGEKTPWIG